MLYQLVVEKQGQYVEGSTIMSDKTMCVVLGKVLRDHPVQTRTNVHVVRARTIEDVRQAVDELIISLTK